MINLPNSTNFNKRITKQEFYENMNVTPAIKKAFVNCIKLIYWRNKISPETVNISRGNYVSEIEIIEIRLNSSSFDDVVLRQIDKCIPYHILFLLEYDNRYQASICYKEITDNGNISKMSSYYSTEWFPEDELELNIDGLNTDVVYENFIRQVAKDKMLESLPGESFADVIERMENKNAIERQIESIRKAVWREQQPKKKFGLYTKLRNLEKKLEDLTNGKA